MTTTTSTKIRNFKFLMLRYRRFSIEYQSYGTDVKIVRNPNEKSNEIDNENVKVVRKNTKYGIGKNVKLERRYVKETRNQDNRDKKIANVNCKCTQNKIRIDRIRIGLRIVEQIAKIGSALSGLLPSIRYGMIWNIIVKS